jgi:proliferating cell nuclear antigen
MKITFRDRKTGITRSFSTPLEQTSQEFKEPSIETTARFTIMADDFKALIQDLKVIGDVLTLEAKEDRIIARAQAEDKRYEWVMKIGAPLVDLEVDEEARASYSKQSLESATKPTGAAENVKVEFATDYPMKAEFTFPNAEKLVLYIAPTVE